MLQMVRCDSEAAFDALEAEWRALETQVPGLLPFQTFVWNRAWWRAFAEQRLFRSDRLCILVFRHGSRLVGVMPLFETLLGLGSWRPVRHMRPFGADPNLTEIRTPLVAPGFIDEVLDRVLALMQADRRPTAMHLIAPADAMAAARARHPGLRWLEGRRVPNYLLSLEGDWTSFRAGLKRNIKESLRRCYNSLSRDDLRHDCLVFTRPDDIQKQLPLFYRLHARRASVVFASVNHPDYFASARHRSFLEELVREMNRDDSRCVHLFCLRIEHEVVAMRLGFKIGDSMYLYYSGYHVGYGRYSVMTTLLAETLRWCLDNGLRSANLSIGTDVSKTRWGPDEAWIEEAHIAGGSALPGSVGPAVMTLRKELRSRVKRLAVILAGR